MFGQILTDQTGTASEIDNFDISGIFSLGHLFDHVGNVLGIWPASPVVEALVICGNVVEVSFAVRQLVFVASLHQFDVIGC